ncbi:hypothetical protein [Myxococcus fulvus]|uniref:hypothetical protein n=1 Tax=Myxococcus fulvus TaxID=33 RepID=UPI0015A6D762|nr:hypothetical protein [Myxococcus fulvus]
MASLSSAAWNSSFVLVRCALRASDNGKSPDQVLPAGAEDSAAGFASKVSAWE